MFNTSVILNPSVYLRIRYTYLRLSKDGGLVFWDDQPESDDSGLQDVLD